MGLPAEQQLVLTDTAPFAQLADMDLDRAKETAYERRKDYLSLLAQIRVADRERLAVKYQRLPVLAFGGFYGVIGETEGLYHGVFAATGSLKFPIFREAGQRGDTEVITAQLMALRQREADLRVAIEAPDPLRHAGRELRPRTGQSRAEQRRSRPAGALRRAVPFRRRRGRQSSRSRRPGLARRRAGAAGAGVSTNTTRAKLQLARNTGIVETAVPHLPRHKLALSL